MLRRAQVKVERFDVFLTPEAEAALPAGAAGELALWRAGARPHPLTHYGIRSVGPIKLGKGLIDPERVASYEARARALRRGWTVRRERSRAGSAGAQHDAACASLPRSAPRACPPCASSARRACCEAGMQPPGRAASRTAEVVPPDGCGAAAQVHNGVVFTANPDKTLYWKDQKAARWTMNPACGHMVHLNNLFALRSRASTYPSMRDTSHHWAIDRYVRTLV
jgi:hypothetical protein